MECSILDEKAAKISSFRGKLIVPNIFKLSLDASCDLLKVLLSDITVIIIPSLIHNLHPR